MLHVGSLFVSEQHMNIVLCVCSGDGVEVKKEEEQMETWEEVKKEEEQMETWETGECNVQVVQEHCCITY
jgi:hypothetical protein